MNEYKAYIVVIRKDGRWQPVTQEFTEFSCYSINTQYVTLFNNMKQASKFKKEIISWKKLKIYRNGYHEFGNIEIAEIKLKPFNKNYMKVGIEQNETNKRY